jgi:hypothetical protein
MPTKLKGLKITSTDLVTQGANPDAHIQLFKRRYEGEPPDSGGESADENSPPNEAGLLQKIFSMLKKAVGKPGGEVRKDASTFKENLITAQVEALTDEAWDCCFALRESFVSIIQDGEISAEERQALILRTVGEFTETVTNLAPKWSGITGPDGAAEISKNTPEKEENMKIDKTKMTPEELAALEAIEKKYGVTDEPAENPGGNPVGNPAESHGENTGEIAKSAALHPDVKKALDEAAEVRKAQSTEIEALKKSLEISSLTAVAKKYELLGKKPEELAPKLYDLKKAGGTAYDDYVALLDESLTMIEKSGAFAEIGSNRSGSAGVSGEIGIKAAEIAKGAGGVSSPEAFIKAYEENPELAAQYEKEYTGGNP